MANESGTPAPHHLQRVRPPKLPNESTHPGLPAENPLSDLSPTARYILETARRLLLERGFEALTIENVLMVCGVQRPEDPDGRRRVQATAGACAGGYRRPRPAGRL